MRKAAVLSMTLLLFSVTPALSQPRAGAFFLRGSVGFATQSLSDWNDDIRNGEQALQGAGLPVSFDTFGGTVPFLIEAGYFVSPVLSLSVGVGHQSDSVDNSYGDPTGLLSTSADVAMTSVTGALCYWVPTAPGLFLGAEAGVGIGSAKNSLTFRDYTDPANDLDASGDWSGNSAVGGLFGGYQYEFPGGFTLHGRLGYQFSNLGKLDGTLSSPQIGSGSTPPVGYFSGQFLETDFSGLRGLIGVGVAFGGR